MTQMTQIREVKASPDQVLDTSANNLTEHKNLESSVVLEHQLTDTSVVHNLTIEDQLLPVPPGPDQKGELLVK